jgi:hypothetical protein
MAMGLSPGSVQQTISETSLMHSSDANIIELSVMEYEPGFLSDCGIAPRCRSKLRTATMYLSFGHLVVVAEGLDLLLVSAGGDIGDEGGRATRHLNSQFMIVFQKHDRADLSKREDGKIPKI